MYFPYFYRKDFRLLKNYYQTILENEQNIEITPKETDQQKSVPQQSQNSNNFIKRNIENLKSFLKKIGFKQIQSNKHLIYQYVNQQNQTTIFVVFAQTDFSFNQVFNNKNNSSKGPATTIKYQKLNDEVLKKVKETIRQMMNMSADELNLQEFITKIQFPSEWNVQTKLKMVKTITQKIKENEFYLNQKHENTNNTQFVYLYQPKDENKQNLLNKTNSKFVIYLDLTKMSLLYTINNEKTKTAQEVFFSNINETSINNFFTAVVNLQSRILKFINKKFQETPVEYFYEEIIKELKENHFYPLKSQKNNKAEENKNKEMFFIFKPASKTKTEEGFEYEKDIDLESYMKKFKNLKFFMYLSPNKMYLLIKRSFDTPKILRQLVFQEIKDNSSNEMSAIKDFIKNARSIIIKKLAETIRAKINKLSKKLRYADQFLYGIGKRTRKGLLEKQIENLRKMLDDLLEKNEIDSFNGDKSNNNNKHNEKYNRLGDLTEDQIKEQIHFILNRLNQNTYKNIKIDNILAQMRELYHINPRLFYDLLKLIIKTDEYRNKLNKTNLKNIVNYLRQKDKTPDVLDLVRKYDETLR